jgi:hypothetical protein
MCREEYRQAVQLLREFSAQPQKARQYSSYDHWRADHLQHRRVEWNPQTSLQEPLTASQQVGVAAWLHHASDVWRYAAQDFSVVASCSFGSAGCRRHHVTAPRLLAILDSAVV